MSEAARETRAWIRRQTKDGRQAARPAIALGLATTALAILRAFCIAAALSGLLEGEERAALVLPVSTLLNSA